MSAPEHGGKTTVFILPGLLGTVASDWAPHWEQIRNAGYEPVGVDWPGHGTDSSHLDHFTIAGLVEHVLAKMDTVETNPCLLWGYSLGGYIGLEVERQQPGRLSGLWMHATKFYWTDDEIAAFREQFDPETMPAKYRETLQKIHGERWEELLTANIALFDEIVDNGLTDDDLEIIRMPVLVTTGDQDDLVKSDEVEQLADILMNGELSILSGVRHPLHSSRSSLILPAGIEFSDRVLG
ncbi:MAG: alpha/beta hydrolase [bacterium]|nr:alpha/beta hydrolase [bacterium]